MDGKELSEIPLKDYPNLSDEILHEIIAYYGQTYDNNAHGLVSVKYKYAYELMTLKSNKNLVRETARLVKWTWYLAIATMIVAVGTVAVALLSFIRR
jgi:hypothetical protein